MTVRDIVVGKEYVKGYPSLGRERCDVIKALDYPDCMGRITYKDENGWEWFASIEELTEVEEAEKFWAAEQKKQRLKDNIRITSGQLEGDLEKNLRTFTAELHDKRVTVSFPEQDFFIDPTLVDRIQNLVMKILILEVSDGQD